MVELEFMAASTQVIMAFTYDLRVHLASLPQSLAWSASTLAPIVGIVMADSNSLTIIHMCKEAGVYLHFVGRVVKSYEMEPKVKLQMDQFSLGAISFTVIQMDLTCQCRPGFEHSDLDLAMPKVFGQY